MNDSEVSVKELCVRYSRQPGWALAQVSFRTTSGAVALLGPNGAGKTTLFRVLSTALPPTSGSFTAGGRDGTALASVDEFRRRLGYLPQDFRAFGGYTCRELVSYVAWLRQVSTSGSADAVEQVLSAVGLSDRASSKVKTLSGGMVRRLGLAQALVNSPKLLLLDEPTVGLDPEQRAGFMEHLRTVSPSTSIVLATHLVEDAAAFAAEVVILRGGSVVFAGPITELCEVNHRDLVTGPLLRAGYLRAISSGSGG